jgi:hypothetical protein
MVVQNGAIAFFDNALSNISPHPSTLPIFYAT